MPSSAAIRTGRSGTAACGTAGWAGGVAVAGEGAATATTVGGVRAPGDAGGAALATSITETPRVIWNTTSVLRSRLGEVIVTIFCRWSESW